MSLLCGTCQEPLSKEGNTDYATCSICNHGYHFTTCCTLGESSWRTMGSRRTVWKCTACKEQSTPNEMSQSLTPDLGNKVRAEEVKTRSMSEQSSKGNETSKRCAGIESNTNMNDLSYLLNSKMSEMQKCMSAGMEKGFRDLEKKMNTKLEDIDKQIGKKLTEFETTLNFYGDKVDEANTVVRELREKMCLMEKRLEKSEKDNVELRTRMNKMEKQTNWNTQKEFDTKIEVTGFKDKNINEKEVVKKIVSKVSDSMEDFKFMSEKIVMKMGEENQEKTTIVMQFTSKEVRNQVLSKIKNMKLYNNVNDNIVPNGGAPIFFNEALSPYYKKLLFEAGRVKRAKKYAYLWVKDGKILLKKEEKGKPMRLELMEDLAKL